MDLVCNLISSVANFCASKVFFNAFLCMEVRHSSCCDCLFLKCCSSLSLLIDSNSFVISVIQSIAFNGATISLVVQSFSVSLIMPFQFSAIWSQYHNFTLINIIERWNNVVICIRCRTCVKHCEEIGCIDQQCFPQCKFSSDGVSVDQPWYMQEPLYLRWKQWDCQSDCRYHCMVKRESQREALGYHPVKYHGKWPFKRIYGIQVCFIKLLVQLHVGTWNWNDTYSYLWLLLCIDSGTCFCSILCPQPFNAFSWLAVLFCPSILQVTFETRQEGILWICQFVAHLCALFNELLVLECCFPQSVSFFIMSSWIIPTWRVYDFGSRICCFFLIVLRRFQINSLSHISNFKIFYFCSMPWLLSCAIEVQWCGFDREIRLLICCGSTWVFTHSGDSKKFQCETWGYQSYGCSSFACFCTYTYLIHQLLRTGLW